MKRKLAVASLAASFALLTAACGGADEAATQAEDAASSAAEATPEGGSSESAPDDMAEGGTAEDDAATAAGPVGPGCADYAAQVPDGEGSVEGMTDDPVAVAAGNNPVLTQLTAAVSGGVNPDVDLVDTLNGGEFTVFAPVDSAFQALPAETLTALQSDADLLSSILTYHVVEGRIAPEELAGTTQTTVQGGEVEVTGEPEMLVVDGAGVVCGGVQTANATVYLVDSVLTPPAAG